MGPYALFLFVVVVVLAVAQSQDCSADPVHGAFEFSEFCRPLRDKHGVRFGQICVDTKLNDKKFDPAAGFLPSCIRAKFRTDDGYELNMIRAGAHFNEPPTGQDRFTSRRNIDRWKTKNGVTDTIRWARVLMCPEELQGQTDCCGQSVGVVGSAMVSAIGDSDEPFRVFLSAEDEDELCTTREGDNTTACDVMIACPPCESGQCRGPGGVCEETAGFECPIGEEPYVREDEFCDCRTEIPSPTPSEGPTKLVCVSQNAFQFQAADGSKYIEAYHNVGGPTVSDQSCDFLVNSFVTGGGPCNQPIELADENSSIVCRLGSGQQPFGCPRDGCTDEDFLNATCTALGDTLISTAVFWYCREEEDNMYLFSNPTIHITCASQYADGRNTCVFSDGTDCNCPTNVPPPMTLPPTNP